MSIMKKVALSNAQVFEVVGWYNNDFKKNKRNEVLPLKLQLDLQRNIGSLIEAAQSYEKVCKQLVMNVQKEYFTEEKTIEEKKIQKDENGEEKEVFEHILKDEYKDIANLKDDLKQLFIVAKVELVDDTTLEEYETSYIKVEKFNGVQCPRCWNYFDEDEMNGELCSRCASVAHRVAE